MELTKVLCHIEFVRTSDSKFSQRITPLIDHPHLSEDGKTIHYHADSTYKDNNILKSKEDLGYYNVINLPIKPGSKLEYRYLYKSKRDFTPSILPFVDIELNSYKLINDRYCPYSGYDIVGNVEPDCKGLRRCPLHGFRWNENHELILPDLTNVIASEVPLEGYDKVLCKVDFRKLYGDKLFLTPLYDLPHNDKENGQNEFHYHTDTRYGYCVFSNIRVNVSENLDLRYFYLKKLHEKELHITPIHLINKSKLKYKCINKGKCPHRGYDLRNEAPDETGIITCPLHGLQFDSQTKELITKFK